MTVTAESCCSPGTYSTIMKSQSQIWCRRCTGGTCCHHIGRCAGSIGCKTWCWHSRTCKWTTSWGRRCLTCTWTVYFLTGLRMASSWRFAAIGRCWIHVYIQSNMYLTNSSLFTNMQILVLIIKAFTNKLIKITREHSMLWNHVINFNFTQKYAKQPELKIHYYIIKIGFGYITPG